jgi:hypothetical protein
MLGLFYCFFKLPYIYCKYVINLYNVTKINYSIKIPNNLISKKKNLRRKKMAKSDLLKEAIADAKAVKETALANAKIALEEAFAPRIQSMLSTKLAEDEYAEFDEELPMEFDEPTANLESAGEMDLEAELGGEAPIEDPLGDLGAEAGMEDDTSITIGGQQYELVPAGGDEIEGEFDAGEEIIEPSEEVPAPVDDMELESIIRELEEDLNEDVTVPGDEQVEDTEAEIEDNDLEEAFNIDEIIESILAEDDDIEAAELDIEEEPVDESAKEELEEAYNTIHSLRHTINEVNLLNAKLLYTNKLFRNFELNENQKMKVIENFDRAGTTREVKLVFSTLAESFNVPVKKRKMVKESYASKPSGTTAPSKKTKQIINEGHELANRWKKLAGLLPN